jgi:hypothetical protein
MLRIDSRNYAVGGGLSHKALCLSALQSYEIFFTLQYYGCIFIISFQLHLAAAAFQQLHPLHISCRFSLWQKVTSTRKWISSFTSEKCVSNARRNSMSLKFTPGCFASNAAIFTSTVLIRRLLVFIIAQ